MRLLHVMFGVWQVDSRCPAVQQGPPNSNSARQNKPEASLVKERPAAVRAPRVSQVRDKMSDKGECFLKHSPFFGQATQLDLYIKQYPWRDSNARTRFRKPLLYPPELQGHTSPVIIPEVSEKEQRFSPNHQSFTNRDIIGLIITKKTLPQVALQALFVLKTQHHIMSYLSSLGFVRYH